jgi:arylsulfatase A-like enzyme
VRPLRQFLVVAALVGAWVRAGAETPRHAVFDLVANRTLAHLERAGGLVIAAGAPGFAKYLHFSRPLSTWRLGAVEDGRKVALASAQAVLEVPLSAAQARAPTVTLRLKSPARQTVRISAQGKTSPAVPLGIGWQTVRVPLPPLADGEVKLLLTFAQTGMFGAQKAAAAVEWVQIGGAAPVGEGEPPAASDASGLVLPRDGALVYYVQVPSRGGLIASGAMGGCALQVRAAARGESALTATLSPGTFVDLGALAGRVTRLELAAEGAGCTGARLTEAALVTDGPAPEPRRGAPPRNVILWLTDSTRADRYRVFNPKTRVETPIMEAFAQRATTFRVGYVQGNESRVSHASLFTGMYPAQHRFIAEKAKLNPAFVTLPEAVRATGRFTAGFMGNGFIDKFWGFGDGWDLLKNHIHDGGGLRAEDLLAAGKGFLTSHGSAPFFLYIGTIDAHVSWRAHAPWIGKYDPEPYAGPFQKALTDPTLDKIVAGQVKITERDKTRVVALYDSDISYNDHEFGELVKTLEAAGRMDDTMIVFIADHGEEMWDHGRIGHGQSLREELVHIPFVMYYPPLFPAGARVDEGVELVDVLPTIVDALGGKPPADVQGESLVPLAAGVGRGYPRPAIASQYELAHTMRLDRWKLWVGGSGEVRLFDAASDAAESHELSSERPIERRFVTDALSLWMAYQSRWKKSRWGVASNLKPAFAADLEKR